MDLTLFGIMTGILSSVVTIGVAISTWFFKCLTDRFAIVDKSVMEHAMRDEVIHRENQTRFETISIAVARLQEGKNESKL